jgi:hypothetical protein
MLGIYPKTHLQYTKTYMDKVAALFVNALETA